MKTLGSLYSRFIAKSNALTGQCNISFRLKPPTQNILKEVLCNNQLYVLVRLQFIWGQFCRELIIRSAVGGYKTIGGMILNRGTAVNTPKSISNVISSEVKRQNLGFPVWHSPIFAAIIARNLGIQNYNQVNLALSLPAPVREITDIRNFIVHANAMTKTRYEQITYRYNMIGAKPSEILAYILPGGTTRFADWIASLQQMAEQAVK